jgi:hypothetical protein
MREFAFPASGLALALTTTVLAGSSLEMHAEDKSSRRRTVFSRHAGDVTRTRRKKQ